MFDSAEVRVDQPNPNFGHDPYTLQPGGCGDPGLYVHFTPDFILGSYNRSMGNIETAGRQVVHEWAHLRYGVFDEYGIPGDSQYPAFYFEKNGENKTINPLCNFNSFDIPNTNVKLIDPNSNPIIDFNSFHSMRQPGSITNYNSYLDLSKVDINPNFSNQTISDILHKYKNVFSKHNFDIGHIKTNPICISLLDNIPIAQKPYRTSFYNNAEIQKQITELLKYDIIRPSSSPYSSPALLVNKKSDNPNHPTRLYRL
ncbi:hypothetical protein LAZ67_13002964 [Cordylochernes scorpioides]|uniref:Calcium-activated chloride channel N-terminal domain-containing protein n=1 Tax=Cordylochernes scorpioides TaxID=51811 RepID=A0ABY6L4X2_9ARAC|nr:hypothetical protein LAZ67_13002964 [Cordylochernes scorpioides]